MKSLILFCAILLFGVGLFSCAEPSESKNPATIDTVGLQVTKNNLAKADSLMKEIDSIQKTDSKDTVSTRAEITRVAAGTDGTVWYNLPYCGGIRPTQERLDELAQWKVLADATLILKNKSGEYEISVSNKGKFTSQLPAGTYDVYLKKVNPEIWDISADGCEDCLTKPMTSVKLSPGAKNEIRFSFRCPPIAKRRQ